MTYRLLPNALHFSEFQGGYHGTCGETALATALVCATPQIETTADAIALLLSTTRELIGLGWASASGSTTTQHLHDEAIRRGFTPDTFIGFEQPLPSAPLHSLLLSTAGVKPIIIEIAQGGNLPGDERGLQYHFICIVGITDAGYICNDGDNPASSAQLVTYSWSQIEAAVPCGLLVIDLQPGNTQGATPMSVPAGWSDNGKDTLHDPSGIPVIGAMRDYVLSHSWDPADTPMGPEQEVEQVEMGNAALAHKGVVQFFKMSGQLSWDGSFNGGAAWRTWSGQEENALRGNLAAASAQINTLRQQLQAQQAAPAPAPVDPAVKAALQAAADALAPQVALAQELAAAVAKL